MAILLFDLGKLFLESTYVVFEIFLLVDLKNCLSLYFISASWCFYISCELLISIAEFEPLIVQLVIFFKSVDAWFRL